MLDKVDLTSQSAIDYAAGEADALVDKITVRAIVVIVVFLVGLAIYRVVMSRLAPRPT